MLERPIDVEEVTVGTIWINRDNLTVKDEGLDIFIPTVHQEVVYLAANKQFLEAVLEELKLLVLKFKVARKQGDLVILVVNLSAFSIVFDLRVEVNGCYLFWLLPILLSLKPNRFDQLFNCLFG